MAAPAVAIGTFNIVAGVFGALGLASFATTFVPKLNLAVHQITVAIGQTDEQSDVDSLFGNIPTVKIFAIDDHEIGVAKGNSKKTWPKGSINPVPIKNEKGAENVQAEYVSIWGGGANAICIAGIGLKNPNDEQTYGWVGDVGVSCGMPFHWSTTAIGSTANTKDYRPDCIWITGPTRTTDSRLWDSMIPEISPPFFLPSLDYNITEGLDLDFDRVFHGGVDITDYTKIQMQPDRQPLHPERLPWTKPKKKRGGRSFYPRSESMMSILISSPYSDHSVKRLCESEMSWRPDVVSETEGLFCDMDKKLWPLCSDTVKRACFDTETNSMRGRSAKREPVPMKKYGKFDKWGSEEP
ncbi:hypothetical protein BCR34DRAFT_644594 [Clohesyomyces aquaticus]|uniref:Uncharacterized protein n=1 Tax=Clohesyomyces aquaticus TaxID=1231657 RepID=A0A1Y1ZX95_9PLEO|nr:hypothetical protein BCR34DRAFT_644594 [Clohesyomyces aquaticus]